MGFWGKGKLISIKTENKWIRIRRGVCMKITIKTIILASAPTNYPHRQFTHTKNNRKRRNAYLVVGYSGSNATIVNRNSIALIPNLRTTWKSVGYGIGLKLELNNKRVRIKSRASLPQNWYKPIWKYWSKVMANLHPNQMSNLKNLNKR